MIDYKIFPLGDSAITIDFGNVIDIGINQKVIELFRKVSNSPFDGMIEAVPAYSSLTVFYDFQQIKSKSSPKSSIQDWVKLQLEKLLTDPIKDSSIIAKHHRIPVCYDIEFGIDLFNLSIQKEMLISEIVQIHCSKKYRVYMIGFLPGFAYMGEVDEKIISSRKQQPVPILKGSVGIAGKQTGIYPLNSPGGWQIIGRTPLKLFDTNRSEPCLLKAGDEVEFFSIVKDEFENYQSRNS